MPRSAPPVANPEARMRLQVPSSAILHAAGSRALIAQSREKLVTRSLHAELVYNLSGSKHITEALRRWGVTADVTAVLVAVFDASAADVQTLRGLVQGVEVGTAGSIEDAMGGLVDLVATKKVRTRRQRSRLSTYGLFCMTRR
jgi:tRNA threonylcarbamoyladenosine modification (KEOPS) complex Cgi121 subunit